VMFGPPRGCVMGGGKSTGDGILLGAAEGPRESAKDRRGPKNGDPDGVNTFDGTMGFTSCSISFEGSTSMLIEEGVPGEDRFPAS